MQDIQVDKIESRFPFLIRMPSFHRQFQPIEVSRSQNSQEQGLPHDLRRRLRSFFLPLGFFCWIRCLEGIKPSNQQVVGELKKVIKRV